MMGAPNTINGCQAVGSAPVNAITGTTIERPTKMPAMKLPASRNIAKAFFIIHSSPGNHRRLPQDSPCVGSLTAK
jgi:hypothetical protein